VYLIIIVIIIIFIITFMQGIYTYIADKNHISGIYNVVVVLYLKFLGHLMLFCMLTF
jgi:hypothetical protein